MKKKALNYFQRLISTNNTADAKIFVTLIMALHFIITAFMVTFFLFGLAIFAAKGSVNKDLIDLLDKILQNDMIIIMSGLGFVTVDIIGQVWLERAKAKALGPSDIIKTETAVVEKADVVNSKNTSVEQVN